MAYATKEQLYQSLTRNSLQWPKHWRTTIARIEHVDNPHDFSSHYVVHLLNPERIAAEWEATPFHLPKKLPPLVVGTATFSTLEEVDAWARVAARLTT